MDKQQDVLREAYDKAFDKAAPFIAPKDSKVSKDENPTGPVKPGPD